jgi:hypothetical protein
VNDGANRAPTTSRAAPESESLGASSVIPRSESSDGARLIEPRLVALFLAGCVLFGYPIPGLFANPDETAGAPSLYLYLLVSWALFIGAIGWLFESRDRPRRASGGRREPR